MTRPPGDGPQYGRSPRPRQVLGGDELDPPASPLDLGSSDGVISRVQFLYLVVLAVLALVAAILFLFSGAGVASPVLFVLALALFLGWIIF